MGFPDSFRDISAAIRRALQALDRRITVLETAPPAVSVLDDLTDVNAPAPTNNYVLTWDSTPGEWVAAAAAGGVTDHGALTGLADDDHTQYLNTTRHDAHDHSTAVGTAVLNDLSDVSGAPATDDVLTYNGSGWVPDALSNIATGTPVDVQVFTGGAGT